MSRPGPVRADGEDRHGPVAAVRAERAEPSAVVATPVAAATVVLVRPGTSGPEVLLTRRPATMAFAPDVYVFPGGRVDPDDARPSHPLAGGLSRARAAERLAGTLPPSDALAHHVAAVRETHEETGIRILAPDLIALSRWVTPAFLPRRFDVRFFAVEVPAGTDVVAGSAEVAAAFWITPAAALQAVRAGHLALLLPTLLTLEQLALCVDSAAIAAAFRPGPEMDPPSVGVPLDGLAVIEGRWAGGIAGRAATGWLIGHRDLVLVDPGDPTGETTARVDAAVQARDARLVGVALTSLRPDRQAGVELYAAGRGLPVVAGAGAGAAVSYPVRELAAGDSVPFGDLPLVAEALDMPEAPDLPEPGTLGYRLPDGRLVPPRFGDRVSD